MYVGSDFFISVFRSHRLYVVISLGCSLVIPLCVSFVLYLFRYVLCRSLFFRSLWRYRYFVCLHISVMYVVLYVCLYFGISLFLHFIVFSSYIYLVV